VLDHQLGQTLAVDQDHPLRQMADILGGLIAEAGGGDEDALGGAEPEQATDEVLDRLALGLSCAAERSARMLSNRALAGSLSDLAAPTRRGRPWRGWLGRGGRAACVFWRPPRRERRRVRRRLQCSGRFRVVHRGHHWSSTTSRIAPSRSLGRSTPRSMSLAIRRLVAKPEVRRQDSENESALIYPGAKTDRGKVAVERRHRISDNPLYSRLAR
jgi:hypothetical protein